MKSGFDVSKTPLVVIWEANRNPDVNSPAGSVSCQSDRHRLELNTAEAEKLIADVADLRPPIFSFTGSDPLRRSDIYQLIESAAYRQLHPALSAQVSALITSEAVLKLKKAGLSRLALSLEGPTQELQDDLSGVPGSFSRTMAAMLWASRCLLPTQVNTNVSRRNVKELEDILHVISSFRLAMWNLIFQIPTARGEDRDLLSSVECEQVFARIYKMSKKVQFKIKTTEAQHYRRYVLQQRARSRGKSGDGDISEGIPGILPINEAKGLVFISHTGDVFPGAFLPLSAGNVRDASLADIYRNSELFQKLRDTENLEGKCGNCECREICGGSRARVYAMTGELFGEDPSCIYQPKRVKSAKVNRAFDPDAAVEASST
jgi:radical SAM protein with 4Fe4S-binding SPASM domain